MHLRAKTAMVGGAEGEEEDEDAALQQIAMYLDGHLGAVVLLPVVLLEHRQEHDT